MGLVTRTSLVCDRCGREVPAPAGTRAFDMEGAFPGWRRVGDRALCPDCAPGYELLAARHRVEAEDYVTGADRPRG